MFQTQPPKLLLKALKDRHKGHKTDTPLNRVEKDYFVYRAGRRGIKGSLDQYEVLLDTIQDYYFSSPDDANGLYYSQQPSVLNLLLHFTNDKLIVEDDRLICRYRSIDKWHEVTTRIGEDLFTTSFLAAYDLYRGNMPRASFHWDPYLNVETSDVNHLFTKDISEIHAHLKGSSMNFELSWLSLMNFPCHRENQYLKLFGLKHFGGDDKKSRDLFELYQCVALAAAIRMLLFARLKGNDASKMEDAIKSICKAVVVNELQDILDKLSALAWYYRSEYGKKYEKVLGRSNNCPDYAIDEESDDIITVLSGERKILYNSFRLAYNGDEQVALYLYAYVIFKQQLREKIIQFNDVVGFGNFDNYERRKSYFIPEGSVYERILSPMSFLNFLSPEKGKRYMEGRIVPKDTAVEDSLAIRTLDDSVEKWIKGPFPGYYIFHFIKKGDKQAMDLAPRHYALRKDIKTQALALYEYRNKGYVSATRVVGIDAANSEIKCRPEVFAQAFRLLRRHEIQKGVSTRPAALGFTYHVGEDFYDIVDGLRAVDEVMTFMNFRSNDRLGHVLVLGTDVNTYYEGRGREIRATRQVLLDNFVWLYVRVANLCGRTAICEYLEQEARYLFQLIYKDTDCSEEFDIRNYYDSWLLRGDAPDLAFNEYKKEDDMTVWGKCAKNSAVTDVNRARQNNRAKRLYYEYHYNKKAKVNGNKAIILPIAHKHYAEFVEMVEKVREVLLCKIERLHIAIECNPSSNLRIGEMTSYIEHPIFRFNNYGLNTPYLPHEISVSINTDDSGVFATSLEREYALMGIALEKTDNPQFQNSPRAVKEWLNRVRKMSVEQRFKKD